ncbi:MAG: hypothetical protein J2P24_18805 [Streptosporangiales bacterium]|nr:hypothetical protein [Streptosporangiales bacterium]MBO0891495.1 hypothetical protein [Acidothermales bacterium]
MKRCTGGTKKFRNVGPAARWPWSSTTRLDEPVARPPELISSYGIEDEPGMPRRVAG